MNIFLDDNLCKKTLTPLSLTRHVSEIRIGISSIREKWELLVHNKGYHIIISTENCKDYISIPANIIPTNENYTHLIELSSFNKEINESSAIKIIKYPKGLKYYNDFPGIDKDKYIVTEQEILKSINTLDFSKLADGKYKYIGNIQQDEIRIDTKLDDYNCNYCLKVRFNNIKLKIAE